MLSLRVLAAAKGLLALVEHADHGVEAGLDIDFLADRGLVAEQLFPGVVAQDAHVRAALVFLVGEETAFAKRQIADVAHFGRGTLQNGPGHLLAVVLHADVAHAELAYVLEAAVGCHHMRQRAQRQHVVEGELLARQLLGGGPHADDRHVEDPEDIRAQRTYPSPRRGC